MRSIAGHCIRTTLACAGAAALVVSCSTPPAAPTAPAVVWPAPPQQARITHLVSASCPSHLGAAVGGATRFANWLTGARKGDEPFVRPFGIALDDAGNLLMTDTGANAVGWLDGRNRRWHRWERVGRKPFQSPVAVAKIGETLYVADSAAGEVVAFGVDGDEKFRIREGLTRPAGLAAHGGKLFVADSLLHAILVFDSAGRQVGTIGSRGDKPGEFNFPSHLAFDSAGRLHVTDAMNGRIQVFDPAGGFLREFGSRGDTPGHFGRPKGLAVDGQGNVYVLDALFDCLQIFNPEGRLLLTLGETGRGPGGFWMPNGIAIAPDRRIFVADAFNGRIQVLKNISEP